jgi:hypothetical protein
VLNGMSSIYDSSLKLTGEAFRFTENIIAIAIRAVILVNVFMFLRFMCC